MCILHVESLGHAHVSAVARGNQDAAGFHEVGVAGGYKICGSWEPNLGPPD